MLVFSYLYTQTDDIYRNIYIQLGWWFVFSRFLFFYVYIGENNKQKEKKKKRENEHAYTHTRIFCLNIKKEEEEEEAERICRRIKQKKNLQRHRAQ